MQLARQILQPMPVGVGSGELRGDLGAIDGAGHHAERVGQHPHVEPAVMKEFDDLRIGQQPLQIGGAGLAGCDLHHVGVAVAARQLHDAKPVAADLQAQRFGVDCDRLAENCVGREIAAVQADGHTFSFDSKELYIA